MRDGTAAKGAALRRGAWCRGPGRACLQTERDILGGILLFLSSWWLKPARFRNPVGDGSSQPLPVTQCLPRAVSLQAWQKAG